jgi:hypothetical protein
MYLVPVKCFDVKKIKLLKMIKNNQAKQLLKTAPFFKTVKSASLLYER